jgi:hypothetical protein
MFDEPWDLHSRDGRHLKVGREEGKREMKVDILQGPSRDVQREIESKKSEVTAGGSPGNGNHKLRLKEEDFFYVATGIEAHFRRKNLPPYPPKNPLNMQKNIEVIRHRYRDQDPATSGIILGLTSDNNLQMVASE